MFDERMVRTKATEKAKLAAEREAATATRTTRSKAAAGGEPARTIRSKGPAPAVGSHSRTASAGPPKKIRSPTKSTNKKTLAATVAKKKSIKPKPPLTRGKDAAPELDDNDNDPEHDQLLTEPSPPTSPKSHERPSTLSPEDAPKSPPKSPESPARPPTPTSFSFPPPPPPLTTTTTTTTTNGGEGSTTTTTNDSTTTNDGTGSDSGGGGGNGTTTTTNDGGDGVDGGGGGKTVDDNDNTDDGSDVNGGSDDNGPKTMANPTRPGDMSLEGRNWAERNPGALRQPGKERSKGKELGAAEKATAKLKREGKSKAKENWEKDLAEFEAEVERVANELAKKHDKTYAVVRKALRGITTMAKERALNVQHAKVWALSKELNKDRPRGERLRAHEVAKLTKDHPPFQNMTKEEEKLLLEQYEEEKEAKDVGVRLNNASAAKDVTAFTQRVHRELNNLQKRTGAIGCLLISRSDVLDTLLPACVGPPDGMKFFPVIMRSTDNDFATNLEVNFNELRKTSTSLIADGFERATSHRTVIKYVEYDKLVAKYGVEIVGWPESVPFKSPSDLNKNELLRPLYDALMNGSCQWERMSDARKKEHGEAVAAKPPKEKTPAASSTKKRQRSATAGVDGEAPKPKRIKLADLTPKQLKAHMRKRERRHKRRQQGRHHGVEVSGIASDSDTVTDYSNEDDNDEEEEEEDDSKRKGKGKGKAKDDDEYSDGEGAKAKKVGGSKAKGKKHVRSEDEDEDEVPEKKTAKKSKKAGVKSKEFVEDSDEESLPENGLGPRPLPPLIFFLFVHLAAVRALTKDARPDLKRKLKERAKAAHSKDPAAPAASTSTAPVASTSRLPAPSTQPVASTSRLPPSLTEIAGYKSGSESDKSDG
ncbi:hypothetical protein C8R46DRAFT_1215739 [Mycena filopes]|nr:hypothetical protein C8R46DRAFT_1215739 [Mycena filopes]